MSIHRRLPQYLVSYLSALKSKSLHVPTQLLSAPSKSQPRDSCREGICTTQKPRISKENQSNIKGQVSALPQPTSRTTIGGLTARDLAVMAYLAKTPCRIASRREVCRALKIRSGSVEDKIQKCLVTSGIISVHRLQKGKGIVCLWEILDKGCTILGLSPAPHPSIGGKEHAFIIESIQQRQKEQGCDTTIEVKTDNGHLIDLVTHRDLEVNCYEVGLSGLEREVEHCVKIWQSNLCPSKVIHVVRDGKDKKQLESLLEKESRLDAFRIKITVTLAGEFIAG